MIVVKVELWPHGDASQARELERVSITNVDGTPTLGEYNVQIADSGLSAHVGRWPRQRRSPLQLVCRALQALGCEVDP